MIDFTGKKFMVTGASSGIGRATAILVSKLGAKIIACGRDENRLDETLSKCEGNGHAKLAFDVRDTEKYNAIFNQAIADSKKFDGLIYSAGIAAPTPLRVFSEKTLREVLDVNLISFMMMVAMYSKRQFNNGGSIVAMSALNAYYPHKCMSAYAASKMGLEGAVRTLAIELADKNIRINCVAAGPVDTPMTQGVLSATLEENSKRTLLGMAQPEDVANMIVFLLSDLSKQITGRSMYVDSGWLGQ